MNLNIVVLFTHREVEILQWI